MSLDVLLGLNFSSCDQFLFLTITVGMFSPPCLECTCAKPIRDDWDTHICVSKVGQLRQELLRTCGETFCRQNPGIRLKRPRCSSHTLESSGTSSWMWFWVTPDKRSQRACYVYSQRCIRSSWPTGFLPSHPILSEISQDQADRFGWSYYADIILHPFEFSRKLTASVSTEMELYCKFY